ncbi:DUF6531 domain-containing protein [Polaribacter sp.]|uniref:DUF6531 domain-containing protein n=1 Tax=Polaribacter sp. TaxID=1920175 RepID=UPI003EF2ED30
MKNKLILAISFFFTFLNFGLFAGVNINNGNFYISYTDVSLKKYQSAFESITRTYNSKSTYVGLFGYGWGTKFETYLRAYPDGSLKVKEHGTGNTNLFTSPLMTNDLIEMMIDDLMEVILEEEGILNNPEAIASEIEKLKSDFTYRTNKWDAYVAQGVLEYTKDFPVGMEWNAFFTSTQQIVLTEEGYLRKEKSNIKTELFNLEGQLIKYDLGNGKFNTLSYSNNTLSSITTADGFTAKFNINTNGFVTRISFNDKEAVFTYEGKKLIYAIDTYHYQYKYEYDESYNLTKIIYNPVRLKGVAEDAQLMTYHPKTMYIKSITERSGNTVHYNYQVFYNEDGSVDDTHYATSITKKGFGDKLVTNTYEYFMGKKENGHHYTKKIITKITGIKTITEYDELCRFKPISIKRGRHTTTFAYNNRCLLTKKYSSRGDSINMKYHPTLEKITYVKNNDGITEFEYDAKANLTYAKNEKEVWVKLIYNEKDKVKTMLQADKELLFTYNKIGKPVKIVLKDVGSINVTYKENGKIKGVASEDGHKMALQVTQAFQDLLKLVKPAGVNLKM